MYDKSRWIYYANENNTIRYVLGTKGKKTLVCFGINPSTAMPEKLDNTLKSVKRISENNGYDSWIMLNIYPQRQTNPNFIHHFRDSVSHKLNLKYINQILKGDNVTIWAAWGNLIDKRDFLSECLIDIYKSSKKHKCKWYSFGNITQKGHPHHPLYLSKNSTMEEFDIEKYLKHFHNS